MRRAALRWLWWVCVWDLTYYCARNPWRFFVALPLALFTLLGICIIPVKHWQPRLRWNMVQCWLAIQEGEVAMPPAWLLTKLDPDHYTMLDS